MQRFDNQVSHRTRGQRTEMDALLGRVLHNRQTGPGLVDVELDVAVLVDACPRAVEPGQHSRDQALLDHLGGDGVGQLQVPHALGFAQHWANLAPVVTTEVAPYPLAQIGCLADIQDPQSKGKVRKANVKALYASITDPALKSQLRAQFPYL